MNTLCHDVTASICEYAPVLGLTCKTSHQPGQLNITDYFTVEGMTWALQYGYKPTFNTFQLLMQHGAPLDVIKTIDWTYVPNEDFSEIAARAGHLDALKWTLDNGCPWGIRLARQLQGTSGPESDQAVLRAAQGMC